MKTFVNEVSATSHGEFLQFMSDTGYFTLKGIRMRFEILSAVLTNVRIWYVRRVIDKSFGRSGGAYSSLFGIKQSKTFDLFSVFASRRRVTFSEDLNLQNLPRLILILKKSFSLRERRFSCRVITVLLYTRICTIRYCECFANNSSYW